MYPDRNETLSFDNKIAIVSGIGLDFRSVFSQNHNKKQKCRFVFYKTIVGNFTAGRQIYILLLKTNAFLVRVCALDLLLTKIGIFNSKTNPLEVDKKITLRCIVYLHFSELLFMDL